MHEPAGRGAARTTKRKPREERFSEMLDVATDVFYEKGFDAASLQDIAERLGMLKGSLYYYINSKEDLRYEVIAAVHAEGLQKVTSAAIGEGAALDRLADVIATHVVHTCTNLRKVSVFLHELDFLTPEKRQEITGGHSYQRVFRELVDAAQEEGSLRPEVDPAVATLSILGSVNWVHRWYRPEGRWTPEELSEELALLNIGSIATAKAAQALLKARTKSATRNSPA